MNFGGRIPDYQTLRTGYAFRHFPPYGRFAMPRFRLPSIVTVVWLGYPLDLHALVITRRHCGGPIRCLFLHSADLIRGHFVYKLLCIRVVLAVSTLGKCRSSHRCVATILNVFSYGK